MSALAHDELCKGRWPKCRPAVHNNHGIGIKPLRKGPGDCEHLSYSEANLASS